MAANFCSYLIVRLSRFILICRGLLLAAAHETGLITTLQATLTPLLPTAAPRLARLRASTLRALLLTVLWGVMAGLARPWALRTYTGQLLALLTGRACAYGYSTVERFVALLARTTAPDALTTLLAQWSTRLWHADRLGYLLPFPVYVDGHKKPVFSDVLVPRGRHPEGPRPDGQNPRLPHAHRPPRPGGPSVARHDSAGRRPPHHHRSGAAGSITQRVPEPPPTALPGSSSLTARA